MNEKIKAHLDNLFEGAPKTRKVEEAHQELLAGCLDKYADLTAGGMDSDEACRVVIDGIGDVGELLGYIEKADVFDPADAAEKRKKRAFFTSAGICGYFIGVAMFFLFAYSRMGGVGLAFMIAFAGISTMLIVYGRMSTVTTYEKADDTLVEEMKVQMTTGKKRNKKASLASQALWPFIIAFYLAISFLTGRWDITWMLFLFAAAAQNAILAYFFPANRTKHLTGAYWCLVVAAYLVISFSTFAWHITWILFPVAVALQQAIKMFILWRDEE